VASHQLQRVIAFSASFTGQPGHTLCQAGSGGGRSRGTAPGVGAGAAERVTAARAWCLT